MAKPVSRILVVNDEPLELREFVKGLNAAARSLDNPLGISFTGVTTAKEALDVIARDGDLQSVLAHAPAGHEVQRDPIERDSRLPERRDRDQIRSGASRQRELRRLHRRRESPNRAALA